VSLDDDVRDELRLLEAAHRLRTPRVVDGAQGPRVVLDGVEVTSFASNDYLSLAGDRRLSRAAASAVEETGTGAGASRLIVGNHRRHASLESTIADWLRVTGVRLFNSGFAANVGILQSLAGPEDIIFSDELNHASIIDGCRLSRARVVVYPHCDVPALERALSSQSVASARRRIVVSETLFSMDGDIADVAALSALARKHDAALILDEAHAVGARGPEGRGIAAEANVMPDVLVGTCGKALGSFGAFAATTRAVADLLWNRARPLVFSTGLPPQIPASVEAAIEIVRGSEGEQRRRDLASRARQLRELIPNVGGAAESAIAPLMVGDDRLAIQLTQHLLDQRLYVQGIRPPTVPEGTARLRISLASGHTNLMVANLANVLNDAMRRFPVERHP
jgi:8-amino-7-oxononanoate synthase